MGHEDDRETEFALQFLDLKAHGLTQLRVQVGERFVQEHDLRVRHDSTGQRDTLLLSAGKVARIGLGQVGQAGVLQRFVDPFLDLGISDLLDAQREGHVFEDVHVRPDREGLEHHAQAAFFRRDIKIL